MRHNKNFNHLGRQAGHRKALMSNMASSLILHKRIETTVAKAKAVRQFIEPLVTKSKDDSTHSRRIVFSYLKQKEAVTELFRTIAPKIAERPGGYTRILKTGFRLGVWISNLRAARKARPGSFQVTPEHIALLDAIGMQWDAREAKWAGAFRRAEEYCAAHGNLLVPVNYKTEDGFCLGDWVRRMRENYACAEKKLTAERIAKLEALGMVWTVPQEG